MPRLMALRIACSERPRSPSDGADPAATPHLAEVLALWVTTSNTRWH